MKTLKGGTKVNRFRSCGGPETTTSRMRDYHRLSKHLMYVDDFKLHQFPRKDGKGTQEEGSRTRLSGEVAGWSTKWSYQPIDH